VLVEVADGPGRLLGEAHLARDLRPTLAANLHQLAGGFRPFEAYGEEAPRPGPCGCVGAHGTGHVPERLGQPAPVDRLEVLLDVEVVGAEEGRYLPGIARAAGVLQEQGVEEGRTLLLRELEPLGDGHPDKAGAQDVAFGLPLDHVEDERERRKYL